MLPLRNTISAWILRARPALAAASLAACCALAQAQDQQPPDPDRDPALEQALDAQPAERPEDAEPRAADSPDEAAPEDADLEDAQLQAIIIDVEGRNARWRPEPDADWRPAQVNDVLSPGVEIDVGFRTSLAIRVGKNATILVDRMTTVRLPRIAEDGEILRTTATLEKGRIDVKVDRVGLDNDFSVVTPATTLAVKGTEFAASYGPAFGAEIVGARTNRINAIEVRFFRVNREVSLSGAALATSRFPDPVQAALASTVGAPPEIVNGGETQPDAEITQNITPNDTVRDTVSVATANFALQSIVAQALQFSGGESTGGAGTPPVNAGTTAGPGGGAGAGGGAGPGGSAGAPRGIRH